MWVVNSGALTPSNPPSNGYSVANDLTKNLAVDRSRAIDVPTPLVPEFGLNLCSRKWQVSCNYRLAEDQSMWLWEQEPDSHLRSGKCGASNRIRVNYFAFWFNHSRPAAVILMTQEVRDW